MKKDISVIRESIGKIVSLLTNRSITVTQRGAKAYVQYHAKTGAIQLVNIPYLPDDASDEFIAAVQGFLDHEVGHVLYTDPRVVTMLRKESAKVKNLANAIEDVYVERKMTSAFTGSVGNLNSVRKFYLDKIARPKIDEALAAGDMNAASGYASLVQFRAWGGQTMAADFLASNPKYAKLTEPLAAKLGAELIDKIKKANSSKECLDLARSMFKKLEEAKAPPMPPEEKGGDKPESGGSPTEEPGEDAGSSDEPTDETPDDADKPEAEDEGTVRAEADDSGKERDEKSESDIEDVPPEAGEDGGSEGGDRKEAGDDLEADDDEGKDGDEGEAEEQPDDGLSIADDGAEQEDGEGDSSIEGEGGEDTTEAAPEESTVHGSHESAGEEDFDPFDKERDFDEDMGKALTEAAKVELNESDYRIFSTDWDTTEPAPGCRSEDAIARMVDKTQHMISGIQKSLERAISAKDRKAWNSGQRRGRIAPGSLFRTVVGDDRVFRKRYETHAKNTAVSLLVDCSGSMGWGGKIEVAGLAAYALSSTLERLKISHEVIGFTTKSSKPMMAAMKSEGGGVTYARTEALYMPVFKGFNERLDVTAKARLAHLTEHPGWLRENVDGECLKIAAQRLKAQRAERHVLIVLSDGSPACPGHYPSLAVHLKKTARELDQDSGVEVIGVGIMDKSVRSFYDKHVVLNDIAELPTTLIGQLSKVLLAP